MIAAALLAGPASAEEKPPAPSTWRIADETSKLDGKRRVTVGMVSLGGTGEQGLFMVRCIDGALDGLVAWPAYLGREPTHQVRWKTDGSALRVEQWNATTGGYRTSLWIADVRRFIAEITGKSELVVGAVPQNEGERVLAFPISGFAAAAAPLREACRL